MNSCSQQSKPRETESAAIPASKAGGRLTKAELNGATDAQLENIGLRRYRNPGWLGRAAEMDFTADQIAVIRPASAPRIYVLKRAENPSRPKKAKQKKQKEMVWMFHFGKYKGQSSADVPSDYLDWMLREMTLESHYRRKVENELKRRDSRI
jgi:hypothetical protein